MNGEKPNYNEVKNEVVANLPQVYTGNNVDIYEEETLNMKDFVIGALVGELLEQQLACYLHLKQVEI